uniref:Uncharacterized protein n=1 Tax=Candidatus Kentrum sp. UNK TaxID=2126344 RepID=A0A451AZ85_9GAMM|nr:MAG: hypothetical protein BECKUNK1418G_GA0071005_105425 [Candidatus Kentron sp. UNK]VFK71355.1 MAG: hypothetical protein BECKUNK1418H_GA0071006_106123 [Candidatus Kentron sp. UNK]
MSKKPARKIITFDWAINTVLRDKANFDVLEGFLTALFRRPIMLDPLGGGYILVDIGAIEREWIRSRPLSGPLNGKTETRNPKRGTSS